RRPRPRRRFGWGKRQTIHSRCIWRTFTQSPQTSPESAEFPCRAEILQKACRSVHRFSASILMKPRYCEWQVQWSRRKNKDAVCFGNSSAHSGEALDIRNLFVRFHLVILNGYKNTKHCSRGLFSRGPA